jgi:DUF4097 and DUF4098 domain-containing protein YvlB
MKTIAIFVGLLLFAGLSVASNVHQEFQVQPGKTLDINLRTGGDIRIEGWNKPAVSVNGFVKGRDREDCELIAEQTATGVLVKSRYFGNQKSYNATGELVIRVPGRFNIQIESMGGAVTIQNVEGEFDGRTMGGALELSGLKGKISFSTMGGNINLTKSDLNGEVTTMGGDVLIEDVTGNVEGSTMGGQVIHKKAPGAGGMSSGEVEISSMGGALNVADAPAGADLHTMGGDIFVKSAKDHVRAKTMGGDIRIDSIDGWVRAETMGGDVTVAMTGDPSHGNREVELISYSGDIEIAVPENLAMTLDLELGYTKGNSGRYSIKSDFPVQTKESSEWDYDDGSPRKYIQGSGKVGDGTNRVRIRTINGNIILRKS